MGSNQDAREGKATGRAWSVVGARVYDGERPLAMGETRAEALEIVNAHAALLAERDAARARVAAVEGALSVLLAAMEGEADVDQDDAVYAARAALAGKGG